MHADVPRLDDEFDPREHRVRAQRDEEGVVGVIVVATTAAQGDREVEAETVDMALGHPVAHRIERQLADDRVPQVHRVAAAGDIDVAPALVEAVVGPVVEAAEGEGGSGTVLLGGVVVDDVEDDLEALSVQELDHPLELVEGALRILRRGIRPMRCEEAHGVVAPVVGQAALDQGWLARERVHGEELDRGHPQPLEMGDGVGMGHSGIRPAQRLRDAGTLLGEVDDVGLVDDRLTAADLQGLVTLPVELVTHDDRARHRGRTVEGGADVRVAGPRLGVDLMAVDLRAPRDLALEGLGVGVDEQLVGVVPHPRLGSPGSVHPEAIALTDPHVRNEAEPPAVCPLPQRDSLLGDPCGVSRLEEAQVHAIGVTGIHTDIGAAAHEGHAWGGREVSAQGRRGIADGGGGRQGDVGAGRHRRTAYPVVTVEP